MKALRDYSISIKKIYLIAFLMLIPILKGLSQNSSCIDSIRNNPYSYPLLWDMIENYFYFHYKFPQSPKELIDHIEKIDIFKYNHGIDNMAKSVVIPKLKTNESHIRFIQKNSVFYIQIHDSTYKEKSLSNYPCNYINQYEVNPFKPGYPFLLDNVLYFDENNQAILNDSLIEELNVKFKDIKYMIPKEGIKDAFSFFEYNKTEYPYRLFLNYILNEGLFDYCTNEKMPSINYYEELIDEIKFFCMQNNLKSIIWFGFKHK